MELAQPLVDLEVLNAGNRHPIFLQADPEN
jgi:hypothetical protein